VDERSRRQAALALRLVTEGPSADEQLAAELGSHEAAAEATSYLAGFLLQALALHRGEDVRATARFVAHWLGGGSDEGLAGVRQPP
jgi:hypothetical protein